MENQNAKKQEISPGTQLISKTKINQKIPGVYSAPPRQFSDEETKNRIEEHHNKFFSSNQKTEGSRMGNNSFPIDYSDFFLS